MSSKINVAVIKSFICDNALTYGAFCKLGKITLPALNKIMNNQSSVQLSALFRISKAMGVPIKELFID